jgi:hypothetical protein
LDIDDSPKKAKKKARSDDDGKDECCYAGDHNLCKVQEVHCHCGYLFILIFLYAGLAGFVVMAFALSNADNWILEQNQCYNEYVTREAACILEQLIVSNITAADRTSFYWIAHTLEFPDVLLHAYPDCRFLIRDYEGLPEQTYGNDLNPGSSVACWVPDNYGDAPVNSTTDAVLTTTVWESNTATYGFKVALGLAISFVGLFAILSYVTIAFSKKMREACWVRERSSNVREVCHANGRNFWNPLNFFCTANPLLCLKFCIPLLSLWKFIWNIIVVAAAIVVACIVIIIFVFPTSTRSGGTYNRYRGW